MGRCFEVVSKELPGRDFGSSTISASKSSNCKTQDVGMNGMNWMSCQILKSDQGSFGSDGFLFGRHCKSLSPCSQMDLIQQRV